MHPCLRVVLVDVLDGELRKNLAGRRILSPADGWSVRFVAYIAVEQLVHHSGRSTGAVDAFLFSNARIRCPEMTGPQRERCPLDPVCAHRKELFQAVLRTTFY